MQSFDEPNAPNASTRHSTISDLVVDGRRMMKDEKMLFTRVSYLLYRYITYTGTLTINYMYL